MSGARDATPAKWSNHMSTFELVWDSRCGVAESPVWDAANRRLLFCDIGGKKINAFSVDGGARETWNLPEVVGSFGLFPSSRFPVPLRHRLLLFHPPPHPPPPL